MINNSAIPIHRDRQREILRFMNPIIEITGLKKSFGDVHAVNDLSFSVNEGELFALLGLNGAGKSTTINMICGLLRKDEGKIVIDGEEVKDGVNSYKEKIGVVYQESALDKKLTVFENLECRAALYGIFGKDFSNRIAELNEMLDLEPLLKRPFGKLSGGQRRRADIARALIHSPKILFLDEPTTGLDPQTRKSVWDAIGRIRNERNTTVILTTHYMEEVTDANNVVILDAGKIAAEGTPLSLKNRFTGDFAYVYGVSESAVRSLGKKYESIPDGFKIEVKNTAEATELISKYPEIFVDYEIMKGKMDDVFLAVTGKKLGEGDGK